MPNIHPGFDVFTEKFVPPTETEEFQATFKAICDWKQVVFMEFSLHTWQLNILAPHEKSIARYEGKS